MLSQEDNELITNTDPGTPMGELFRRFWLPVALSEELPGPDCVPVRVTIMGEQLIAFRDSDGRVGLVDAFCPHRGAPMFFGRNEESGLRCVYHGWKFDVDGNCTDLPNAPEGDTFRHKVRIIHYPVVEAGQLLWTYMGPPEKQPPFPHWEWTDFPDGHRYVTKWRLECNYLQAMEGDFDQTHARFLHSTLDANVSNPGNRLRGAGNNTLLGASEDEAEPFPVAVGNRRVKQLPWTDLQDSETGMWMISAGTQPDGEAYASAHAAWMMPVFSQIGLAGPNTNGINMRVPIDNRSAFLYRIRWSYTPIAESEIADYKHSGYSYPELIPGTWTPRDNISNDYNIDRVAQKNFSYTGIRAFPTQDVALIENQRGPIQDRSLEHLTSSDQQVIFIRRKLMSLARELQQGKEPEQPWRPEGYKYRRARVVLEHGTPAEAIEQAKEQAKTATFAPRQRPLEAPPAAAAGGATWSSGERLRSGSPDA